MQVERTVFLFLLLLLLLTGNVIDRSIDCLVLLLCVAIVDVPSCYYFQLLFGFCSLPLSYFVCIALICFACCIMLAHGLFSFLLFCCYSIMFFVLYRISLHTELDTDG